MAKPRFMWGWEVTAGSNDKLDFINAGVTYAATLNPNVYSAKGFEVEVQRAIRAIDTGHSVTCVFDHVAKTFTIGAGTATFSLLFGDGANNAKNCATLLGFTRGGGAGNNKTGNTTYTGAAVGVAPSTAFVWDSADPLVGNSPVTGQTAGTAAKLLQRQVNARQAISDGATVETVYFNTMKRFRARFEMITAAEQTNLESWLDWITQGKPFTFLPDATVGTAVLSLVLDLVATGNIENAFTWLTLAHANYPELVFIEQASA